MSIFKKLAILTALGGLCIPFIRFQSRPEVVVNWTFRETKLTAHTIKLRDQTFTVPAGQSAKRSLRLKGGGRAALIYRIEGWGFHGQQIEVDGKEMPLGRIQIMKKNGNLRILGISRSPSMDVEILMQGF